MPKDVDGTVEFPLQSPNFRKCERLKVGVGGNAK
jgi:hypothetical protein